MKHRYGVPRGWLEERSSAETVTVSGFEANIVSDSNDSHPRYEILVNDVRNDFITWLAQFLFVIFGARGYYEGSSAGVADALL
jgi:hypothetical protein